MKLKGTLLFTITCFSILSCYKTPTYPNTPAIEFDSFSVSDVYTIGSNGNLRIKFTDGDGDLGKSSNQDGTRNCFIKKIKYNLTDSLVLPIIPQKGTTKAISGTIDFKLSSIISEAGCIIDGTTGKSLFNKPFDTLTFQIIIVDRAGHASNAITTPPIIITCN